MPRTLLHHNNVIESPSRTIMEHSAVCLPADGAPHARVGRKVMVRMQKYQSGASLIRFTTKNYTHLHGYMAAPAGVVAGSGDGAMSEHDPRTTYKLEPARA